MGTILSKNVSIAAKIAGTDTLVKTALFFVNERVWAQIEWGKVYDMVSMTPAFHVWFRARARVGVKSFSRFPLSCALTVTNPTRTPGVQLVKWKFVVWLTRMRTRSTI